MHKQYIKGYFLNHTLTQFGEEKVVYFAKNKQGYRNFLPGQSMYSPTLEEAAGNGSFKFTPDTVIDTARLMDEEYSIRGREYEAEAHKIGDLTLTLKIN